MGNIILKDVSFKYIDSLNYIFEHVTLNLNTNWKCGLLGKNGSGKSTFFKLLMQEEVPTGQIHSDQHYLYFPMTIPFVKTLTVREFYYAFLDFVEDWQILIEFEKIGLLEDVLTKTYHELSPGEQTKVQLVCLFLDTTKFHLIDEPTNHLDLNGRKRVGEYLKSKTGYIVVSHDEAFLNQFIERVLYIENQKIMHIHGNVDTFISEYEKMQKNIRLEQEKLTKEIGRLKELTKTVKSWGQESEDKTNDSFYRKKAKKQMKKAKHIEKRAELKIQEKSKLVQSFQNQRLIKLNQKHTHTRELVIFENYQILLNEKPLFKPITMTFNTHDIIWLKGDNGAGKTTLFKQLLHLETFAFSGICQNKLKTFAYLKQDSVDLAILKEQFKQLTREEKEIFYFNLNLLGFRSKDISDFLKIQNWSLGQLKRIELAFSLVQPSECYIWDEVSNTLDRETLQLLVEAIQHYKPTILFVDHNEWLGQTIATKQINLHK